MASEKEIAIQFTSAAARHFLFFNQIGIHPVGDLVEMHFAYSSSKVGIIVVVEKEMLERQKPSFVKYLKQIGLPTEPMDASLYVRDPVAVTFADMIGLARHGEMSEIACHAISWKAAVDSGKKGGGVKAEPMALLRSHLEIHRNWISLLYASAT